MDYKVVFLEDAEESKQKQSDGGKQRELDFATWLLAWDGYSVGAAIADQMHYASALVHKQLIVKIACRAKSERRSTMLAVLYDRLARSAFFTEVVVHMCV